ncbi:class I SAM-dependent methyltransferase [Roseovarius sp. S4756]|uniref:class I SAM-dependent methyltransferase n=1 Tax=Roseovarius maritimus TaxID=3342637 RepID=UPI003729655F
MSNSMWDDRYAGDGYLFGTDPAGFLLRQTHHLAPGRTLAVADGEGRNSVFLAQQGLSVTAFDASPVAVDKARRLAEARGVEVDFNVSDVDSWDWKPEAFDTVVAIFIQFAGPQMRDMIFDGMKRTLKPGGKLLLHGYRPEQLDYGTGGPPKAENMYTRDLLEEVFGDFQILRLEAYDREITEGSGHAGMSALIDLIAQKKS